MQTNLIVTMAMTQKALYLKCIVHPDYLPTAPEVLGDAIHPVLQEDGLDDSETTLINDSMATGTQVSSDDVNIIIIVKLRMVN